MTLSEAKQLYVGNQPVKAMFINNKQVWPLSSIAFWTFPEYVSGTTTLEDFSVGLSIPGSFYSINFGDGSSIEYNVPSLSSVRHLFI